MFLGPKIAPEALVENLIFEEVYYQPPGSQMGHVGIIIESFNAPPEMVSVVFDDHLMDAIKYLGLTEVPISCCYQIVKTELNYLRPINLERVQLHQGNYFHGPVAGYSEDLIRNVIRVNHMNDKKDIRKTITEAIERKETEYLNMYDIY